MSFKFSSVHGTADQIKAELENLPQHERESLVAPVIEKSVAGMVEAIGGYLSVSCEGNLNPIAGDTGDLVHIYITSLPAPPSQSITSGDVPAEVESKPEDSSIPGPVLGPASESELLRQQGIPLNSEAQQKLQEDKKKEAEENSKPPVITETPTLAIPPAGQPSNLENFPGITAGQAEAYEIAQATSPADSVSDDDELPF